MHYVLQIIDFRNIFQFQPQANNSKFQQGRPLIFIFVIHLFVLLILFYHSKTMNMVWFNRMFLMIISHDISFNPHHCHSAFTAASSHTQTFS